MTLIIKLMHSSETDGQVCKLDFLRIEGRIVTDRDQSTRAKSDSVRGEVTQGIWFTPGAIRRNTDSRVAQIERHCGCDSLEHDQHYFEANFGVTACLSPSGKKKKRILLHSRGLPGTAG